MLTTIAISRELRDKIKEFGRKGETYEDIIKRIIRIAEQDGKLKRI